MKEQSALEDHAMSRKPPAGLKSTLRKDRSAAGNGYGAVHVVLFAIAFERSDHHAGDLHACCWRQALHETQAPDRPIHYPGEQTERQHSETDSTDKLLHTLPVGHGRTLLWNATNPSGAILDELPIAPACAMVRLRRSAPSERVVHGDHRAAIPQRLEASSN